MGTAGWGPWLTTLSRVWPGHSSPVRQVSKARPSPLRAPLAGQGRPRTDKAVSAELDGAAEEGPGACGRRESLPGRAPSLGCPGLGQQGSCEGRGRFWLLLGPFPPR